MAHAVGERLCFGLRFLKGGQSAGFFEPAMQQCFPELVKEIPASAAATARAQKRPGCQASSRPKE